MLTMTGHTGLINTLRLNSEETRLLTTGVDGTARVWNAQSGKLLLTILHSGSVNDAVWDAAENRILTTGDDGSAKVWDVENGEEIATFSTYGRTVQHALWSQDDSRILTASDDGRVRQFYVDHAAVITAACENGAVRNMTRSEWAQFMVDEPYRATCKNLSEEQN